MTAGTRLRYTGDNAEIREEAMIVITSEARERLIEACLAARPAEACGLLLADAEGGPIDRIRPVRNAHPRPERAFRFDPEDWVRAWAETRRSRRRIAGFYHSHPCAPPMPSAADLENWRRFGGREYSYWIVSLLNADRPEIAAWRLRGGVPGSPLVPAEISVQIAERHDIARGDFL
jgi:proteasome lid subunit RPN8/RPN11